MKRTQHPPPGLPSHCRPLPSQPAVTTPLTTVVPIPFRGRDGCQSSGGRGEDGKSTDSRPRDDSPIATARRLLARIERLGFEELSRLQRLELAADAIATARNLLGGDER
jgi:hypothetical protein